jgi:hypothetical protein
LRWNEEIIRCKNKHRIYKLKKKKKKKKVKFKWEIINEFIEEDRTKNNDWMIESKLNELWKKFQENQINFKRRCQLS